MLRNSEILWKIYCFLGGFGVDFSSTGECSKKYEEDVAAVSKALLAYGVTSYLPTIITSKRENYHKVQYTFEA